MNYIINQIVALFWKYKTAFIVGGIVLVAVLVAVVATKCGRREPKLNQPEIIKAQQAIEKQDRQQMIEILAQSDAREKAADAEAMRAESNTAQAVRESKQEWAEKSNDELAKELERRAKE